VTRWPRLRNDELQEELPKEKGSSRNNVLVPGMGD